MSAPAGVAAASKRASLRTFVKPGLAVSTTAPARSPWRVLMIGAEPGRLIESNLVVNLNPPSAIADTSWIKPGKTSWDWWSGSVARNVSFETGMNTATMKHYIDFSARSGFEYMLIDAGWAKPGGGPNDSGSDLTPDQSRHRHARAARVCQGEERAPLAVGALDRRRPPDGSRPSRSSRSGASPA